MKLEHKYELSLLIAPGAEQSLGIFDDSDAIREYVSAAVADTKMLIARHPERKNPLGRQDESYVTVSKGPKGRYFVRCEVENDAESGLWVNEIADLFRASLKEIQG
jgi:hypothetical protein